MASVFTSIIRRELPARFVWEDEHSVAFLSINPITVGHSLVVPRVEVDHWIDLDPLVWQHISEVSRIVAAGIQHAFDPPRVGQMIVGFEVPHVHIHVAQIHDLSDVDFRKADPDPDPGEMDAAATAIRDALMALGHQDHVAQA